MVSYKTVLRCMRENGWQQIRQPAQPSHGQQRAADRLSRREVLGFEVAHVHGLWHLDFHQARISIVDAAGKWHRPVALAICDDHSRLCCHLQFYLAETAQCLVHGLSQASMISGLVDADIEFLFNRKLLANLSRCAWKVLSIYLNMKPSQ